MLASTKPLSPLLTVRPTSAPSLHIEQNLDDKIYARLKILITKRRLFPGGGTVQGNDHLSAAMWLRIRRSVERMQQEATAEEAQAE